jgi:type II secretory pathway component PulJ
MKTKHETSWPPRAKGFTLIEAIAGSLLLGSLLVSLLLILSHLNIQSRRAEDRIQASAMLDELMEKWWPDRVNLPRNGSGTVPNHADWRWQTQTIASPQARVLHGEIVAIELFAPQRKKEDGPAARLEILLPSADSPARPASDTRSPPLPHMP